MKRNKGFTLIELLVVIAIIGILSAIVLASLNSARQKANDAKIQGQLSSLRAAAEIYYSTSSNYGASADCAAVTGSGMGADATSGFKALVTAANYPGTAAPVCTTDSATAGTKWSAYHILSNSTYWCVDSSGGSKSGAAGWTAPTGGAACP